MAVLPVQGEGKAAKGNDGRRARLPSLAEGRSTGRQCAGAFTWRARQRRRFGQKEMQ